MTRTPRTSSLFALLSLVGPAAAALAGGEPFIPGQALVRLAPGAGIESFNARYGTSTADSVPNRNIHLVALAPGVDEQTFRDSLAADPEVLNAELNYVADEQPPGGSTQSLFFRVSRAAYDSDPTPAQVQALAAWSVGRGQGVKVAVLDTGVDASHPELMSRMAPGGANFVDATSPHADAPAGLDSDADGRPDEFVGHGTMIAGLVARVAPEARIMSIKIMDSDGVATTFRAARGIYHAIDQGAHVINLSLGTLADPALLQAAVAEAEAAGVVVIASAGNENDANPRHPAAFTLAGAIAVAATNGPTLKAEFSNYGTWITLAAPGTDVVSTAPGNGYARASGTSFAAPLVAGAAAVVLSGCQTATPAEVRAALAAGAVNINVANPSYAGLLGAGRIDTEASALHAEGLGQLINLPDFNLDRAVNVSDLTFFLGRFGQEAVPGSPAERADLNRSGTVDTADLLLFLSDFGAACP